MAGSLKSSVQVPTPMKLTLLDDMVHTPVVADVILTVSPVVAVAETVYAGPPWVALEGAVEVTVITLLPVETTKFVDVAVTVPSMAVKV